MEQSFQVETVIYEEYDCFRFVMDVQMTYQPNTAQNLLKAQERVGATRVAQAQWLLTLRDRGHFDALKTADCDALVWGIRAFLQTEDLGEDYCRAWFNQVRAGFNRFNSKLKKGKQWTVRLGEYRTAVIGYQAHTLIILPVKKNGRDKLADDVFKALLVIDGVLRRCLKCQAFFIRVRRKQFCSGVCANRTRLARFRAKTT